MLIQGQPAFKKASRWLIRYLNCRSRSGCGFGCKRLTLLLGRIFFLLRSRRMVSQHRRLPFSSYSACLIFARLWRTHRKSFCGSPARSSCTTSANSFSIAASFFQSSGDQHLPNAHDQLGASQGLQPTQLDHGGLFSRPIL
jgi:hypothetical protein